MAGVPSGVAADAARDAIALEHWHGRGLDLLDRILQMEPPLLRASCRTDGRGTGLDARGASALLLAVPLVALAGDDPPSTLTVRDLAHCGALEPALRRAARAEGVRFELTVADRTSLLCVDPSRTAIGPAWIQAWGSPLDVRLSANDAAGSGPAVGAAIGTDGPLVVDPEKWKRLTEQAAPYLV